MPKSKYPQKLDSSVELPAVRDSVLSDPINSLRSAVINIERTLGINPQGSTGNTVASRIGRTLDANGFILESALSQAGLLSGPITDKDVAEVAAIKERKLDLNFPTQLLQDQISMVQSDLETIDEQIAEISSKLAIHISPDAVNRHPATAISVNTGSATASDTATVDIEGASVQDVLDSLYNQHINYTGVDISETNNSHKALQIFFDNTNVSGVISADNVQDAIETVATSGADEKSIHQDIQHSNGLLRIGKLEDPGDDTISQIIASGVEISFSSSDGNPDGTTVITVTDSTDLGEQELRPFDFIKIVDDADTDGLFTGIYEIKSFQMTGTVLDSVEIYGLLTSGSSTGTTITIGRNIERRTNEAGLLVAATEEATLTSSRYFQVSNPNCIRVITKGINPLAITSVNRFFDLTIDSVTYNIDTFDAAVSRQSIDTILLNINEQLVEASAHATAYRLDYEDGGSEIAIVHNIPDEDSVAHTLVISRSTDSGIDAIGFGYIEDLSDITLYGSKYFINGQTYSGLKEKIDSLDLTFFAGSNQIGVGNSSANFIELGIREGDLVIITEATDSSDDGSFFVEQVSETEIRINSGQLPTGFTDNSSEDTRIRIYSNTASIEDITFDKVGGSFGSTVLDIFMNKERDIYYSKLLEYESVVVGSESIIDIVDIYGDDFYDETLTLSAEENPNDANAFLLSLNGADSINIFGENKYVWITSGDTNIKLKIFIPDAAAVASKISTDGSGFSIGVYLFENVNTESNILLARTLYNNFNGRVSGGINGPRLVSKTPIGTLGLKDFSNQARAEIVERPLSDLRYNGVIYGFEIENISIDGDNFYNLDIKRGVAYVNGRRIEKENVSSIVTDIDSSSVDKFYVTIDEDGNFKFDSALPSSCITPFGETEFCLLGSGEYDGANLEYIDLRLFIDHLDLKILNSITVSPQNGLAHFTDPVKALKYAKRFSDMFPDAGIPTIHFKSGTHTIQLDYTYAETSGSWDPATATNLGIFYDQQIESGFFIDFPVIIEGEGSNTIIECINTSTFTDTSYDITMPIVIAGNGFAAATRGHDILGNSGYVEIRDIALKNTRISLVDLNIENGGTDLRYNIGIKNLVFDFQDWVATFYDSFIGPRAIEILEVSDTSTDKGGISIEDCVFVKSGIYTTEPGRTKNLTITNNVCIDDNDTANFLFNDLYTFSGAISGSNINISNNRYNSNLNPNDGTGPEMVLGETSRWGERFDRDIRVGNNSYVETDGYIGGSHMYSQTRVISRTFFVDSLINETSVGGQPFQEDTSNYVYSIQSFTAGGEQSRFPYITQNSSNPMRLKLPIVLSNTKLRSIEIGYNNVNAGDFVDVDLYSVTTSGGSGAFGFSPISLVESNNFQQDLFAFNTFNIESETIDYSADNITLSSFGGYLLSINDASANIRVFWVKITVEVNSIEEILDVEIL